MQYAKDGITIATVIDTSHPKNDGTFPIRIRVTYARRRKYYVTGKALTREEWDMIQTTRSRHLLDIRKDIENSYNLIRSAVEKIAATGDFSLYTLDQRLKGGNIKDTINDIFANRLEELKAHKQVGTALCYSSVIKGIERFGGHKIPLNCISPQWVNGYAEFLRQEGKAQTTISIHLRAIRSILNIAKRDGLIKESQYPFGRGRYEIQEGEGRKLALTIQQVGAIARYDDGSDTTAKYRDFWLFIYLCNGINVADMVQLKYRNIRDGELSFFRQKTARTTRTRKEIRVVVTQPMQDIINKYGQRPQDSDQYIFPVLKGGEDEVTRKHKTQYFTRAINKRMTAIGSALGFGPISTYTARHTFATVLKRSGANLAYISESLGHSDLKTTENYLASFEREEREKNAELLTKF